MTCCSIRLHETVAEINKIMAETPAQTGGGDGGAALQEYQTMMLEKLRAMRISGEEGNHFDRNKTNQKDCVCVHVCVFVGMWACMCACVCLCVK
jgi:hypothetical protein